MHICIFLGEGNSPGKTKSLFSIACRWPVDICVIRDIRTVSLALEQRTVPAFVGREWRRSAEKSYDFGRRDFN